MTKEEYKRNLIRMFDSIRDEFKGEESCRGVDCYDNCPFDGKVCGMVGIKFRVYEAIEVVENWAKEHPIVTNTDKFREVFGTEPSKQTCFNHIDCENCEYYIPDDKECGVQAKFWNAEYKPTKEGEE